MQDGSVQVLDVEAVLDGGAAQLVGGADAGAPLIPPPASHIVKP